MTEDGASRREPIRADDEDEVDRPEFDELDSAQPVVSGPTAEPIHADTAAGTDPNSGPDGVAESVAATDQRDDRPEKPKKASKAGRWWEFPVLAAVAILVAILVKSFLIQPFYIPSESMEKTLHGCAGCNGDKILVNKVVYHSRDPHPGEIVVFRAPQGWENELPRTSGGNPISNAVRWFGQLVGVVPPDEKDLVKRVIAVGGQTVRCCDAQGRVQISDSGPDGPWRSLDETYVYRDGPDGSQVFGPVTVPEGRLWVMGDHRNDSADSRYHCGGSLSDCDPVESTVPVSAVIGKAFVIAWPISRWSTLGTPATFTSDGAAAAAVGMASAAPIAIGYAIVAPLLWWRRRRRRRPSDS